MTQTVIIEGLDKLELNMDYARKNIKRFSKDVVQEMAEATQEAVQGQLQWNDGTGKGGYWTGELHDNIYPDFESPHGEFRATIQSHGPSRDYVMPVEEGTVPHTPPYEALEQWAEDHNVPTFVVVRAIEQKGTEGRFMFATGYEWIKRKSKAFAEQLGIDIVKKSFR